MADDGVHRNVLQEAAVTFDAPSTFAVVSKEGDDTNGVGSFESPLLTIAAGIAALTAARNTLIVLPGDYDEVELVWPNITGLAVVAPFGEVNVTNSDAAAAVLSIAPTFTASTFEATIKGAVNLAGTGAQIGLSIANAGMTKKLNVYIDGLSAEVGTSGDSIDIAGTVSGQALRVYAKNLDLEGLFHFTANDAGSRCRISTSRLLGGYTTTGAVTAESTLMGVVMLADGLSIATEWLSSNAGCIYQLDADPATCSAFVDTANG